MPPYKKALSRKQAGEFWMLEKAGRISLADAKGKTRGLKMADLPERISEWKKRLKGHVQAK